MGDKVVRDYSDPQIKEWWEGVDRAAAEAPKLTVAEPVKKCDAFVVSKSRSPESGCRGRNGGTAE